MDFIKNFVTQIATSMPVVTKVAFATTHIKHALKDLERDDTLRYKLVTVLQMFVEQQVPVEAMANIMNAVDVNMSQDQIEYLYCRIYDNGYILSIVNNYIEHEHLTEPEIHDIAEFMVQEFNNALVYR